MIRIIDSCVAVKWLVEEEHSDLAAAVLGEPGRRLVPELLFAEVGNALWKRQRSGELDATAVAGALRALPQLVHEVVPILGVVERAAGIACGIGHPVYDCVYLALAEAHGAELVTADRKLVTRARLAGLGHRIRLIGASEAG